MNFSSEKNMSKLFFQTLKPSINNRRSEHNINEYKDLMQKRIEPLKLAEKSKADFKQSLIGWNCISERLEIINLNTNSTLKYIACTSKARVSCMALYGETKLIIGYSERTKGSPIEMINLITNQNVLEFDHTCIESSNEWLTCMKVLDESGKLATGHVEASIRIWDLTKGKFLYFLEHIFNGFASTCAFMDQFSNGLLMSAHLDFDNSLNVWDLSSNKSSPLVCSFLNETSYQIVCLKVSSYEQDLFGFGTSDGKVKLCRLTTKQSKCDYVHVFKQRHTHLEFISSTVLATYRGDHRVRLWCLKRFVCLSVFQETGDYAHISYLLFNNKTNCLVSFSFDKYIRLWNISNGECCLKHKCNDLYSFIELNPII
jgi:WD40 repeat protein